MAAAASLAPAGTIRPITFAPLFDLLAATGMRISEALALRLSDPTEKLEALNPTSTPNLRAGKFRPPDKLLAMLSGR